MTVEPIAFTEVRDAAGDVTGVWVDGAPELIAISGELLSQPRPPMFEVDEGIITFRALNATLRYEIVGRDPTWPTDWHAALLPESTFAPYDPAVHR